METILTVRTESTWCDIGSLTVRIQRSGDGTLHIVAQKKIARYRNTQILPTDSYYSCVCLGSLSASG